MSTIIPQEESPRMWQLTLMFPPTIFNISNMSHPQMTPLSRFHPGYFIRHSLGGSKKKSRKKKKIGPIDISVNIILKIVNFFLVFSPYGLHDEDGTVTRLSAFFFLLNYIFWHF